VFSPPSSGQRSPWDASYYHSAVVKRINAYLVCKFRHLFRPCAANHRRKSREGVVGRVPQKFGMWEPNANFPIGCQKYRSESSSEFTKTRHFKRKIHVFFRGRAIAPPHTLPGGSCPRRQPSLLDRPLPPQNCCQIYMYDLGYCVRFCTLLHHLLSSCHCVWSDITVHNLTPEKRNNKL